MKSYKFHIITFIAAFLAVGTVWGQTTVSGTWAGGALTGSYKLTGNTKLTGTISVSSATLTIDLNGYTLDRQKKGFVATVGEGRTLVIKDSKGGGVIKNGTGDRGGCALISGILRLEGGTIADCIATDGNYGEPNDDIHYKTQGCGGAFFINQRAKLVMSGGKITNCSTEKTTDAVLGRGGAVFVDAESGATPGIFEMSGGEISNCKASLGGAVYVHQSQNATGTKVSGEFTMSGTAKITNCNSVQGGGVYVSTEGNFTMSGGTITGCKSSSLGSGIYTLGKLNISGSAVIDSNKPSDWDSISYTDGYPQVKSGGVYGGGIYASGENAIINMSGGRISNNWAPSGAGVMLWVGSTMTMTGGEISGNYALGTGGLGNGGAVYVQTATLNLNGGTLKNNTAIRYGGAVNLNQSGVLNLEGPCTITGNKACHGGGLSQEAGECILTLNHPGITISNNTAHGHQDSMNDSGVHTLSRGKGNGGGLFIEKGTLTINGGTISGNSATGHGGGASIYVKRIHGGDTKAIINSGTISGNSAEYGGGLDLYADYPIEEGKKNNLLVQLKDGTVSGNKASQSGAGIYMSFDESNSTAKMEVGTASSTPVIQNNIANLNGGGLGMSNNGVFDVKNANMSGNTASIGGAIWLGSGTFTMANATLTNNIASQNGGGIYVGSGTFTVNGVATLKGNKATAQNGGGIYLGGGTFTVSENGSLNLGGSATSDGNSAGVHGGGVYCGAPLTVKGTSNIQYNKAANGGGIYVASGYSASFAKQAYFLNNSASGNGGGLCVAGGSVTLADNTLSNNNAAQGGAVYLAQGSVSAKASTIQNNHSSQNGGAYYVSGGSVTITGTAKISSNTAEMKGGALYVDGGTISLVANTINNNSAAEGGAIYVKSNDKTKGFTANGSTTMAGNSAEEGNGGAVYVEGGSISITGANSVLTLSDNHAANGGVFYVDNGNITANAISKSTISNNYSTAEGGAFYVNNGNIHLSLTELSGNGKSVSEVKTTNGGAIALKNGVFSFADGSEIRGNAATGNGGALYIANAAATNITCEGGSYLANTAGLGGGIYASGPISLTFAANVRDNMAQNGGGLYLDGGVNMTFGNGLIVGNRAQVAQNVSRDASQYGVGGGIYLAEGELSFSQTQNLGIYNNAASFEAADIYASGNKTTIHLPNVSGMNLTGFDVPGNVLYWVEDFNKKRYEAALRDMNADIETMILDFESETVKTITDTKTCLDLGYDLVFVKIHSKNLGSGDNAAIEISYMKKGTSDIIVYRKVLFMGEDTQIVGLPSGDWKFETTTWSSKYKDEPVLSTKDGIPAIAPVNEFYNITRNHNYEFNLTFTKKEEAVIRHAVTHEFKLVNKMTPGGVPANQ